MKKIKAAAAVLIAAIVMAGMMGCGSGAGNEPSHVTTDSAADSSAPSSELTKEGKAAETAAEASAKAQEGSDGQSRQKGSGGEDSGKGEAYKKVPSPIAKDGDKILFVGNSHTYTNDLPGVFFEMTQAGGHTLELYDLTEGYYTLKRFSDPEDELGKILTNALQTEPWDFVVLQENTNSAMNFNAKKDMYPYARKLNQMIKDAGGQTAFLMTWAPKDGGGLFSHDMVQDELSAGYRTIAKELDALLIPGGEIFDDALKQDGKLELWGEDGQHPSMEGTYLTACTAYALFFQETPVGNPYLADLDKDTAQELQKIADSAMLSQ